MSSAHGIGASSVYCAGWSVGWLVVSGDYLPTCLRTCLGPLVGWLARSLRLPGWYVACLAADGARRDDVVWTS